MTFKPLTFISITFLTLFIIWAAGWLWFATNVSLTTTPTISQKTKSIEAIIVLTGGSGRVNAGLDLLEKKIAPKLFISGVNKEVNQSDILAQWRTSPTKNLCCIFLGYEAENTAGNAREIKKWVTGNNINSFLLVTSSYHMPRTYKEVSNALPNVNIMRYPIISNDTKPWGGRFFHLTFKEYNKIIFIWLRLGHT